VYEQGFREAAMRNRAWDVAASDSFWFPYFSYCYFTWSAMKMFFVFIAFFMQIYV